MIDFSETPKATVMHLLDAEGDPTRMDVVRVPEGFSFQMWDESQGPDTDYISVIVTPGIAMQLVRFLKTMLGED